MLRRVIVAASFATLAVVAAAGDTQVADPAGRVFVGDLGNDGTMEKVLVRKTGSKDGNDFYQLVVQDDTGKEIWAGPKTMDTDDPLVFGVWDWGVSLPQALGDIDGDGRVELVAEAPRSDVSPASFRVFGWTGSEFKPVRTLPLLETPAGSGFYPWAQSERYMGCWIDKFEKVGAGGEVTVGMMEYTEGKPPRTGKAVVTAEKNGYRLKKWISPLKRFRGAGGRGGSARTGNEGGCGRQGRAARRLHVPDRRRGPAQLGGGTPEQGFRHSRHGPRQLSQVQDSSPARPAGRDLLRDASQPRDHSRGCRSPSPRIWRTGPSRAAPSSRSRCTPTASW